MKQETLNLLLLILVTVPVTIIDLRYKKIPDVITYPGIILLLIIKTAVYRVPIYSSVILLVAGFVPFFLIWYFTKGKMGLGDAKLSAFLCLVLGLEGWFLMVFISSSTALIFALYMLWRKKIDRNARIPYGPFLSLGAVVSAFIL